MLKLKTQNRFFPFFVGKRKSNKNGGYCRFLYVECACADPYPLPVLRSLNRRSIVSFVGLHYAVLFKTCNLFRVGRGLDEKLKRKIVKSINTDKKRLFTKMELITLG